MLSFEITTRKVNICLDNNPLISHTFAYWLIKLPKSSWSGACRKCMQILFQKQKGKISVIGCAFARIGCLQNICQSKVFMPQYIIQKSPKAEQNYGKFFKAETELCQAQNHLS